MLLIYLILRFYILMAVVNCCDDRFCFTYLYACITLVSGGWFLISLRFGLCCCVLADFGLRV